MAPAVEISGVPVLRPGTEPPEAAATPPLTDQVQTSAPSADLSQSTSTAISAIPGARPVNVSQGHEFRLALGRASQGDWNGAAVLAARSGQVAADVIEWKRLRSGRGSFGDYLAFLERNGDWPGLKLLRRRGEGSIPGDARALDVIAYFAPEPPQTGRGVLRLAQAYNSKGEAAARDKLLADAWTSMELSAEAEAALISAFGARLAAHHTARLEDAQWRKDREATRRFLKYADDETRAVANARLALQARSGNADALYRAVPTQRADDPGLARDRMDWLIATRQRSAAAALIVEQSQSRSGLGRPSAWAEWRRVLARQAMRDGDAKRAYALASSHGMKEGSAYADLEWLSGYLALRYQDDPAKALTHFRRFRSEIFTPISMGRAGYWEARALEDMGEAEAAMTAYRAAAQYQTSFYGLLAAERAGVPMQSAMTGRSAFEDWQSTNFARTSVFKAAQLFAGAGERYQYEVTRFLRHLAETTAASELVALGDYTVGLGNPYVSVRVAKQIANEGVVAHRAYYPLTALGPDALPVEEALALAIARRESEFYPLAVSGAGARGLMQLMPGTAQDMARKLALPYSFGRLTRDPVYNVRLGSAYLDHLRGEFGPSVTLISVGYNAGPHRARTWSERFGDPRRNSVDIVDWIEHIPFRETRNYVMRVAESLPIYRARLTGEVAPIRLTAELRGK